MIRCLNLGCGGSLKKSTDKETWVNTDIIPLNKSVVKVDCRFLKIFKNEEFDIVYASHILEHISRQQCKSTLKEWVRVLKRGGKIKICVPNLDMIAAFLTCRKMLIENAVNYIYGNQRDGEPGSFHKNGFDKIRLVNFLMPLGIKDFKSFKGTPDDGSNSIYSLNLEGTKK